jgi:hypothetical protein
LSNAERPGPLYSYSFSQCYNYWYEFNRLFPTEKVYSQNKGCIMIDCLVHAERYYHYIINGTKEMGWRPVSICTQVDQAYDTERDIGFFKNAPESWTKVSPG